MGERKTKQEEEMGKLASSCQREKVFLNVRQPEAPDFFTLELGEEILPEW